MLIVKSNSEHSLSVASNTNRLVSSTNDNFGGVKPGTYIRLGEEDFLYSINKTSQFFYPKDFELINNKTLKIRQDTSVNLQPQDTIKITYEEYEVNSLINIIDKGKFCSVDDVITVLGGELSVDVREGIGHPTKFKVEEVDDNGSVLKLSLLQRGKYIVPPPSICSTFSQNEFNVGLELKYSIIDNQAIQSRVIKSIQFKDNETILELDYSLPSGVKQGKLSVEKWEIYLNQQFLGDTKFNLKYRTFKDFTPALQLPIVSKGSNCFEILHNEAMIKLENKIVELNNKIEELKRKQ